MNRLPGRGSRVAAASWVALAVAAIFGSPAQGDGGDAGADGARRDSERAPLPRSTRRAADGDFEGVDGWGPLHWNMDPEAAVEALARAGIDAEYEPGPTAMFDVPCPIDESDCDGHREFVDVTFDEVTFEYRGWRGRAEFASWQLREIALMSPRDPEEWRGAAVLADLESLYGSADRRYPAETYAGFTRTLWRNPSTDLTVICGHLDDGWSTVLRYERNPRGWP